MLRPSPTCLRWICSQMRPRMKLSLLWAPALHEDVGARGSLIFCQKFGWMLVVV
jgi:hypothetical protein